MNLLRKAFQHLRSSLGKQEYNDNNNFEDSRFPYDLPSDLPSDYSYPEDAYEEPDCDCFFCQAGEPCASVREFLRRKGFTAQTDWRLR